MYLPRFTLFSEIFSKTIFQITGYEEIQPELDETGNYRLYSVIYTLKNGEMVCTEARGDDIQYPADTFRGLDSNPQSRITLKVTGNTDQTMTRRFFGQWLRFEQIATQIGNDFRTNQIATQTSSISDSSSDSGISLPNKRENDSDDVNLNYDTN